MIQGRPEEMDSNVERLEDHRTTFQQAQRAPQTVISYAEGWKYFCIWCDSVGLAPLPCAPETLSLFATALIDSGRAIATVVNRVTSVAAKHKQAGFPSPYSAGLRSVITGAKRIQKRPQKRMAALSPEQLKQICMSFPPRMPASLQARNRSILMLGFACALRRSEICGLDVGDVTFEPQGVRVRLRWSKTDQKAEGRDVGMFPATAEDSSICPVELLRAWLAYRGTEPGPLYTRVLGRNITARRITGMSIWNMLKKGVAAIGLDRSLYAGHSLRSGFVTSAVEAGESELAIMQITGHRSVETLRRYVRPATAFSVNPLRKVL